MIKRYNATICWLFTLAKKLANYILLADKHFSVHFHCFIPLFKKNLSYFRPEYNDLHKQDINIQLEATKRVPDFRQNVTYVYSSSLNFKYFFLPIYL